MSLLKEIHNIFAYYGRPKHKEMNARIITFFDFIWCDVKICTYKLINIYHNILKKHIYIKNYEMNFNFMKFVIST
jgi:hypothetical protein